MRELHQNNKEHPLTLAQRVQLITRMVSLSKPLQQISGKYSCIICNTIILDPDCTGLTCGESACLGKLGDKLDDLQKENKELVEERREVMEILLNVIELVGMNVELHRQDNNLVDTAVTIEEQIKAAILLISKLGL